MHVTLATFARQPGGVWRNIADLATGLGQRGVGVSIGLPDDAVELRRIATERGITVVSLDDRRADVWHLHLHDTYERRALPALARRRRHQTVVATEHLPRTNASTPELLPGQRRAGAQLAKSAFKRAALAMTDATIAVSQASAHFLRSRYGRQASGVFVVHNGIAPQPPVRPEDHGGPARIVVLGSVIVQKGMDLLVDAAAGADRWEVRIVGEGPHRRDLEVRAMRLGASVHFVGWQDDPSGELRRADILCLPSRWEALPYVVMEAMAIGRPVIAFDVDGVSELVDHGRTGVLVAPEDAAGLRTALDDLAPDRPRQRQLGDAGAERVRRLFGLDEMVDGTLAVYERAHLDGRR